MEISLEHNKCVLPTATVADNQVQIDEDYALSLQLQEEQFLSDSVLARHLDQAEQQTDVTDSVAAPEVINVDDDDDDDDNEMVTDSSPTIDDAILAAELQEQFNREAEAAHQALRESTTRVQRSVLPSRIRPQIRHGSEGDPFRHRQVAPTATTGLRRNVRLRGQQALVADGADGEEEHTSGLFGMLFSGGIPEPRSRHMMGMSRGSLRVRLGDEQFVFGDSSGDDYEALWDLADSVGEVRRRGLDSNEINALPTTKFTVKPSASPTAATPSSFASAASSSELRGRGPARPALVESSGGDVADTQCLVCLENFKDSETLRTLPCLHQFHRGCIDEWIKRNAVCPVCRISLREQIGSQQQPPQRRRQAHY